MPLLFLKVPMSRYLLMLSFSLVMNACIVPVGSAPSASPTAPIPTSTPTPQPTIEATPKPVSIIDTLDLSSEQATAMKAHAGLEASIRAEADGRYTTTVQVLNVDGAPVTQSMDVDPKTLHEDLTSKNEYGDTPVMTTIEGKKLYWIQEQKGWYGVEISPDIHKPVMVPLDKTEIATRVVITEFNQPFSQAALERWKTHEGLAYAYMYLEVNAKTHEGTAWAFLMNESMQQSDLTYDNAPIQTLDAWFATELSDGTKYEFFPTKWLDPFDPNNPQPDEWKIIFNASGQEIMGDESNRSKFDAILAMSSNNNPVHVVVPIFRAREGFFDSTLPLITFAATQPSLAKLLAISENDLGNLIDPFNINPDGTGTPLNYGFDHYFPTVSPEQNYFIARFTKDSKDYDTNFFPPDIQTLIFPSLVILK